MRRFLPFLTVISIVTLASAASPQKDIGAIYAQITEAVNHKDLAAYSRILAPDCKALIDGKAYGRAELVATIKDQMEMFNGVTWPRTFKRFTATPDRISDAVDSHFKATLKDGDGKHHKFQSEFSAEEVWVRSGKTWLLKFTTVKSGKILIDGKSAPNG